MYTHILFSRSPLVACLNTSILVFVITEAQMDFVKTARSGVHVSENTILW